MKPTRKTATMILRILCAMVFLSVGFAHRMPTATAREALSVAYSLPDGTFADLCIADDAKKHANPSGDCEACRLAGAILLPSPPDHAWLLSSFASLGAVKAPEPPVRSAHLLDRPRLRGPPLSA
ncbi:hypothetical protein DFO46_1731 [Rhizobium sp. AG855]|nr:hypothetical protein DFO46_1731 [Rhizobium sp. AG855]